MLFELSYLSLFLLAFVLSFCFYVLTLKFFPKLGLLDKPEKYGLERAKIPYSGGVVIFLVFALLLLFFVELDKRMIALLLGSAVVVVLGFIDDFKGLSPLIRLFVQAIACLILIKGGIGILSINLPFVGLLEFSEPVVNGVVLLSAAFTVFWVMAVLNTMNFVDGIGGLSSGVSFVGALTLFLLSTNADLHVDLASQAPVANVAIILAGISLAFLIFDFPKPKMLMGDSGSTFLGFVIATLAIFSGGKVATAFLVLGIPILDMLFVVLRRLFTTGKFWQGDKKHLHHRLLAVGLSEKQVVSGYLLITVFLGGTAVLMVNNEQKFFMMIALFVLMLLLLLSLILIPKRD